MPFPPLAIVSGRLNGASVRSSSRDTAHRCPSTWTSSGAVMQYAGPPQSTALVDVKIARSAPRPNVLDVPFWSKRGETSEVPSGGAANGGLGKVAENI